MKKGSMIMFLIYAIFGAYFIISSLELFSLPEFFSNFNKWITLVGGILIILGGFNYLRINRLKFGY
jgi:hypothetical protein